MSKRKPMLSILVMTPGKKRTVEDCLMSLDHLRETVPCELIVTDTGCDTEHRKMIERYADEVIDFEWCNDFSKARNTGLRRATGEFVLILDDDEVYKDTKGIENFFLLGMYQHFSEADVLVRDYADWAESFYVEYRVPKVIRRTGKLHYEGAIHEQLQGRDWLCVQLEDAVLGHYGYIFDTVEELLAHENRNLFPLEEHMRQHPDDIIEARQLANEYYRMNEFGQLEKLCRKYYEADFREKNYGLFGGGLFVSLNMQSRWDEAKDILDAMVKNTYADEMVLPTFYGEACIHYSFAQDWEQTYHYGNEYLKYYWKTIQQKEGFTNLFFMERAYRPNVFAYVCAIFLVAAVKLRRGVKKEYLEKMPWDNAQLLKVINLQLTIQPDFEKELYPYIEKANCQNPIIKSIQLLYGKKLTVDEKDVLLRAIMRGSQDVFSMDERIYDFIQKEALDVDTIIREIPLNEFKNGVKGLHRFGVDRWRQFQERLDVMKKTEDVRYDFFDYQYAYKCMGSMEDRSYTDCYTCLMDYHKKAKKYYMFIYRSEAWEKNAFLEPEALLNRLLEDFFELDQNEQYTDAIRVLKQAVAAFPALSETMRVFAHQYSDYVKTTMNDDVSPEMKALASQIRAQAKDLMAQGCVAEAKQVLQQLLSYIPNDSETMMLLECIAGEEK